MDMLTATAAGIDDWHIAENFDLVRRKRLLADAPEPAEVIRLLARLALSESKAMKLEWQPASDPQALPNMFRIISVVRVTAEHFDWIFNGRTGYRAAYWVSVLNGMTFNIAALQAIEPAIKAAYDHKPVPVPWERVRASLLGEHSKIWAADEKAAFDNAEVRTLMPDRWREVACRGARLPMPNPPAIDVKGTFCDEKGEVWLDPMKLDRHSRLHRIGHT